MLKLFFSLVVAAGVAFAKTEPACEDLLLNALGEMGVALAPPADALDHTKLGPEGQEIFDRLDKLMIGHGELKLAFARAVQRAASGIRIPRKPIATFLLLGVTGTGKTLSAEALAEALNGDPEAMIAVDCGEMQKDHEISKLTGSPAGYVGHESTEPMLSGEKIKSVTHQAYNLNILLIDEIEKASPALQRLLLGVLDKGRITTGKNEHVDLTNTIVIMTSNLGQADMQKLLADARTGGMGFGAGRIKSAEELNIEIHEAAMRAASSGFAPEFQNRIDKIFVFKQHTPEEATEVLRMTLAGVQRKLFLKDPERQLAFRVSGPAQDFLLSTQYRPEFGGRSLRRTIENLVIDPLVNLLASKQVLAGDVVEVGLAPNAPEFEFKRLAGGLAPEQMAKVYQSIYGMPLPEIPKTERVFGNPAYAPERFAEFVERLTSIPDNNMRLDMIDDYLKKAPEFHDYQFLGLLKALPNHWGWGRKETTEMTQAMKKMKFGNWKNMSFEPIRLYFFWYGMSRIKSLSAEHRTEMNKAIGPILEGLKAYLAQAGLKDQFQSDILQFVRAQHERVMQLPDKR